MRKILSAILMITLVVSFVVGVMSSDTNAYVDLEKKGDGEAEHPIVCFERPISFTLIEICCSDPNGDWHCAVFPRP